MKRALLLILIFFQAVFLFAGGSAEQPQQASTEPVIITDSFGRELQFSEVPNRIVSVAPNLTEFVYALGLGENLVGRTDYDTYPEAVYDIDSVGSLRSPNIERIIELEPDVVLVSTHFSSDNVELLDSLGITVVSLYYDDSFEGVYQIAETLGEIFQVQDEATTLVAEMQETVEYVLSTVAQAEYLPSVYYVVGYGEYGDFTAGGDTFIGSMLEMAGGRNIAADLSGWSYSFEKIVENDPDVIICSENYGSFEAFSTTEGYAQLRAVTEDRLVAINDDTVNRQGPRLAEGLLALAGAIHPELFSSAQ